MTQDAAPSGNAPTNPLFNDNRLKLGVFGLNAGHQIFSTAPERFLADWDRADVAVGMADRLGLEVAVSLMGWGRAVELEPFTWAAALGARYPNIAVIATMHVQLMHPAFVAKAAATIDRVTGGRFGINLVAGTSPDTFGTFGAQLEDHETRYDHAAEFIELVDRFWESQDPFDFDGRFYQIKNSVSQPKPVQRRPAIMNAGLSGRGRDFACKHADIIFTHVSDDRDAAQAAIAGMRSYARETYGREIQVWSHGYAVIRETEQEALDFLDYYAVQNADRPAIEKWVATIGANAAPDLTPEERWKFDRHWGAGGGMPLVGNPEQVAQALANLSDVGLDGVLLNSMEPETMLGHLGAGVLPRLEAAGLRKPR